MRALFRALSYLVTGSAVAVLSSCGSQESKQLVQEITAGTEADLGQISFSFADQLSLNVSGRALFGNQLGVELLPAETAKGFQALFSFTPDAFGLFSNFTRTSTLPNGVPFAFGDVREWQTFRVALDRGVVLTSLQSADTARHVVGFAMELPFVDARFPKGLIVSQPVLGTDGKTLGSAGFYGPAAGKAKGFGGIFVVADAAALAPADFSASGWYRVSNADIGTFGWYRVSNAAPIPLAPAKDFVVQGADAQKYRSETALFRLFQLFSAAARQAGFSK